MAFGRFRLSSSSRNTGPERSVRDGSLGGAVGSGTMARLQAARTGLRCAAGAAAGEAPPRFTLREIQADFTELRFQLFDRPGVIDGNRRLLPRQGRQRKRANRRHGLQTIAHAQPIVETVYRQHNRERLRLLLLLKSQWRRPRLLGGADIGRD